mgnify:CR=1 FL=1
MFGERDETTRLSQNVSTLVLRGAVLEHDLAIRNVLAQYMVPDVDVLRTLVQDWIFAHVDARHVVLVDDGWSGLRMRKVSKE